MSSERQIQANRRNAQFSTGPKTCEGKDKVSSNAISLGLYARRVLLPGEDEGEYALLLQALYDRWEPQNPIEERYVREICDLWWKIERLNKAEQAYLSDCVHIEAARRKFEPESTALVLDRNAVELSRALDRELLKRGLDMQPNERDLREALKQNLTEIDRMQICANLDGRRQYLLRSLKRAEAGLTALQAPRTTIEVHSPRKQAV
jgi:hypothetical protein